MKIASFLLFVLLRPSLIVVFSPGKEQMQTHKQILRCMWENNNKPVNVEECHRMTHAIHAFFVLVFMILSVCISPQILNIVLPMRGFKWFSLKWISKIYRILVHTKNWYHLMRLANYYRFVILNITIIIILGFVFVNFSVIDWWIFHSYINATLFADFETLNCVQNRFVKN